MDELDSIDPLAHPDRAGLLARATDWRARVATVPDLTSDIVTPPSGARPRWFLPPECVQLGELACALSAPDLHLRPSIVASRVRLGQRPQAWLVRDTNRSTHATNDRADLDPAESQAGAVQLAHLCQGELHPTQVLLNLYQLIQHLNGRNSPLLAPENLAAIDSLLATTPTEENPAKRLARMLHERIPLFWGSDIAPLIGRDWMMRQLWYAERQAWSADDDEVAMLHVLARFPRYVPNCTAWVNLELTTARAPLSTTLRQIALRRRLPLHSVEPPTGLTLLEAAVYLLEFGEWLALYAALLNNVDPDERVPHQILF